MGQIVRKNFKKLKTESEKGDYLSLRTKQLKTPEIDDNLTNNFSRDLSRLDVQTMSQLQSSAIAEGCEIKQ